MSSVNYVGQKVNGKEWSARSTPDADEAAEAVVREEQLMDSL